MKKVETWLNDKEHERFLKILDKINKERKEPLTPYQLTKQMILYAVKQLEKEIKTAS